MNGAIRSILCIRRGAIVLFLFPVIKACYIAKMKDIILSLGMKRRRFRDHLFASFAGDFLFEIFSHSRASSGFSIRAILNRPFFYLEKKPVVVFRILALQLDQAVSAAEDTSLDFENPLGGRRLLRNIVASVPNFNSPRPILAFGDRPFEAGIVQRMILHLDGQPSDAFSGGRFFGDRPAFQHPSLLQAQIKVKAGRLMALDDVNQIRFFPVLLFDRRPSRLRRISEISFFFICL